MKINEVTNSDAVESLLSIVSTHINDAEHLAASKKQLLQELGEVQHNRHIYIAYENEIVVAMAQLVMKNADNDPELANGIDIAHVHNLQVRSELQGRGIGKRMMAYIEDKARALRKTTLTLGVDDTNERAIGLYHKLGYKQFKTEPGRTPDEECLVMKKSL